MRDLYTKEEVAALRRAGLIDYKAFNVVMRGLYRAIVPRVPPSTNRAVGHTPMAPIAG